MWRYGRRAGAVLAVALLATTACGTPAGDAPGTINVFAAASLTETFTRLGADFENTHPGTTVRFSFAGSSALAAQLDQGAPADVFASASPVNMAAMVEAGNADGEPVVFVRNQLVIAVPEGNPQRIAGLADLSAPGRKVALCAEQVPCGAAARTALAAAGVTLTPVTLEQDVKGALSKVLLGEVDAALVYRTDVQAAAKVEAVDFPESTQAVNDYLITVLADAANPAVARRFVAYVRSDSGRAVLTAAGFQEPGTGR